MNIIKKIKYTLLSSFVWIQTTHASSVNLDDLIFRPGESTGSQQAVDLTDKYEGLENVGNLPEVSVESAVTTAIKTVLGWSMIIALVAIVVAGIYYLKSEGDEEQVSKAKRILVYLVIGMVFMAAAYGLVAGVVQFQFFR